MQDISKETLIPFLDKLKDPDSALNMAIQQIDEFFGDQEDQQQLNTVLKSYPSVISYMGGSSIPTDLDYIKLLVLLSLHFDEFKENEIKSLFQSLNIEQPSSPKQSQKPTPQDLYLKLMRSSEKVKFLNTFCESAKNSILKNQSNNYLRDLYKTSGYDQYAASQDLQLPEIEPTIEEKPIEESEFTPDNQISPIRPTTPNGNCGPLAIADQLALSRVSKTVTELRQSASDYLKNKKDEIAGSPDFMATITVSLKDYVANSTNKNEELITLLAKENLDSNDYIQLTEKYADLIKEDKVWVDSAFFAAMAPALERNIFIIRQNTKTPCGFVIYEKFSSDPLGSKSKDCKTDQTPKPIYIFYNGKITSSNGNHFESFDSTRDDYLNAMIDYDKKIKINDLLDNLRSLQESLATDEEKQAQASRYITDLKENHPKLYKTVLLHFFDNPNYEITNQDWKILYSMEKLGTCTTNSILASEPAV
ncbi:MAG: hypothetical protein FJZ57_05545 [Chlamydiae bacterium]|nr:hypothetical protein [Chlamydiota bacterium]